MSSSWILYLTTYAVTGNPLVALAAVLVASWLGEGWWRGRLYRPWAVVDQWMRIRELRALVEVNPHDARARADLGRLLVERGRFAEAAPHLEAAIARAPDVPLPLYHLGRCRLAAGQLEEGAILIEQALAIRPDLEWGAPLVRLGDALRERGDADAALKAYERASTVHTSSSETWYKIGLCKRALGDAPGAKAAFRQAVACCDQSPRFKRAIERPWAWRARLARA